MMEVHASRSQKRSTRAQGSCRDQPGNLARQSGSPVFVKKPSARGQDSGGSPALTTTRPARPLYSLDGIVVATVLGSFIAGVFMVAANYMTLGSEALAKRTFLRGLVVYVVIIVLTMFMPNSLWIGVVFMFAQAALAFFLAQQLQGPVLQYHKAQGVAFHGLLRSAIVGVFAGLVAIIAIVTIGTLIAVVSG